MTEFERLPSPIRIGLVADTHLVNPRYRLPQGLIDGLSGCDLIWHAGDINRRWVLERLGEIAPVQAVHGNNDELALLQELPEERYYQVGRHYIGLLHGFSSATPQRMTAWRWTLERMRGVVDCAIYGHSHRPEIVEREGLLMVNPGSPTQPRWAPSATFGVLEVGATIRARLLSL